MNKFTKGVIAGALGVLVIKKVSEKAKPHVANYIANKVLDYLYGDIRIKPYPEDYPTYTSYANARNQNNKYQTKDN